MAQPSSITKTINKPRLFQKPMPDPSGTERVVVLAPHQDDESLGCGGRVIQLKQAGARVTVIYTTDGRLANGHLMTAEEIVALRKQEALEACAVMGIEKEDVVFLAFHDGSLPSQVSSLAEQLKSLLHELKPTELYFPYRRDFHTDHEATSEAAWQAISSVGQTLTAYEYLVWGLFHKPWITLPANGIQRKMGLKNTVRECYGLRLLWAYRKAVFADISEVKDRKKSALQKHRSQVSRLVDDPSWLTLADVAEGSWLRQFEQDYELFRRTEVRP